MVRSPRGLILLLMVVSLLLLVDLGRHFLADRRIGRHSLITLESAVTPETVAIDGHTFAVTGASVREVRSDRISLRAWTPTPTIRVVEPEGGGEVTVEVDNLPRRMQLEASGPVQEGRAGLLRTLRFAPQITRRLGFADQAREVTFAVLGDTGDSPTFLRALRLAASHGADFLLLAGDLIYLDAQIPHLRDILASTPLPIFIARGNHDYRNETRITFMRQLSPPYYTFRLGGATFIILDNADSYLPTLWWRSTQYHWLTTVLSLPAVGPLFVVMHKPPFDPRPKPQRQAMADTGFAQALMRHFARAGVDAVFAGHIHASHRWTHDGIPYVISGEGFASPEGVRQNHLAWVHVRGWNVTITQKPIWDTPDTGASHSADMR